MSDEDKRKERESDMPERPSEPRSPGEALGREERDILGEGELSRREDMGPGEHRPHQEDEEDQEDKG